MTNKELHAKVEQWFIDRNLQTANPIKQLFKLMEEAGELFEGIAKGDEALIKDAIGDVQVVLIGLEMQLENSRVNESIGIENLRDYILLILCEQLGQLARNFHRNLMRGDMTSEDFDGFLFTIAPIKSSLRGVSELIGTTNRECLAIAYNEIKDRKGKMIDGVFVKEEDLK